MMVIAREKFGNKNIMPGRCHGFAGKTIHNMMKTSEAPLVA